MTRGLLSFAKHELIAPGSNDPRIKPVGNVFHVAVSESKDLRNFFENDGGIESHGYILRDGTVKQYRNMLWEADAQSLGNSWFEGRQRVGLLSWESQGMGEGEWTPEQIAAIQRIIQETHQKFDIPMNLISTWNGKGNGYHCQFSEWNPDNHSCPGPDRVKQFHNIIVPWMSQGGQVQEDDVSAKDVWDYQIPVYDNSQKDKKARAHVVLAQAHNRAGDARAAATQALNSVKDLAKLVSDSKMTDQEKADLATKIANEVQDVVTKIDAGEVASNLEITTKE